MPDPTATTSGEAGPGTAEPATATPGTATVETTGPAPTTIGPQRNRVTPMGDIIATGLRGAWLGNRGILHRGHEIVSFHRSELWIICALRHKDWRLPQWQPGHFTVLFFHDEAVAMAAGHRPCALCRRPDYRAFSAAVADRPAAGRTAKDLDRLLQAERLHRGTHRRRLHPMHWPGLPDGTFVLHGGGPVLLLADTVITWTPGGYAAAAPRPRSGTATVITPPTTVAALRAGYPVQIDDAARELARGEAQPAVVSNASGPTSATDA